MLWQFSARSAGPRSDPTGRPAQPTRSGLESIAPEWRPEEVQRRLCSVVGWPFYLRFSKPCRWMRPERDHPQIASLMMDLFHFNVEHGPWSMEQNIFLGQVASEDWHL